jgi:modulator of FtsH protease HflC
MKKNLLTIIISAVLALIFVLLLFVFQVRKSEIVVVTRLGRVDRQKVDPGAYFRLPWPIENVYRLDQRIQNFEGKFAENFTADYNNLLSTVYVGWRITNATTFFPKFAGGSAAAAERMLEDIVGQAKVAVVGKHPLGDFVNANEEQLKFDAIENEIKALVTAQLATNNCGIGIEYLGIKRLGLPESVTQAVFDRMTKERGVLISKLDSEGRSRADIIRSTAESEAAKMISGAEGQARLIRGQGEAVAAEVLPVFEKNPELAKTLLRLEALEASTKERTILIFDMRTPPFDLFSGAFLTNKTAK